MQIMETKMVAFHGDASIKSKYINRVKAHRKADELVKGATGNDGKGCAVWCTLNRYDHRAYQTELGIPQVLARIEDRIFENSSDEFSQAWPERFLEAAKPGSDLSMVWPHLIVWILVDPETGVFKHAKTERTRKAIQKVADLYREVISGKEVSRANWRSAAAASYAASYAAYAASHAAYAAAYASYAASHAAAYAASYAAYAAAAAADAADSRTNRIEAIGEKLITLMSEAPIFKNV